jgi:hypothetical protein
MAMSALQYQIWTDVLRERERQVELQAAGRFKYVVDDPALSDAHRVVILGEEFGEAAHEVGEECDKGKATGHLRDELIQVLAVALAWVERMDLDGRK